MAEQRERTVASGFPKPDDVAGPTERLRQLNGESDSGPEPPRYGRARAGTAATQDTVGMDDMATTAADRARSTADALETFGRRLGSEALDRAQEQVQRAGIAERMQMAGLGARQAIAGASLGVCAAGAATAGIVLLWSKIMPSWAAALTTAGTLGVAAAPLLVLGANDIKRGVAGRPSI